VKGKANHQPGTLVRPEKLRQAPEVLLLLPGLGYDLHPLGDHARGIADRNANPFFPHIQCHPSFHHISPQKLQDFDGQDLTGFTAVPTGHASPEIHPGFAAAQPQSPERATFYATPASRTPGFDKQPARLAADFFPEGGDGALAADYPVIKVNFLL
jgi:hypothetical protein